MSSDWGGAGYRQRLPSSRSICARNTWRTYAQGALAYGPGTNSSVKGSTDVTCTLKRSRGRDTRSMAAHKIAATYPGCRVNTAISETDAEVIHSGLGSSLRGPSASGESPEW